MIKPLKKYKLILLFIIIYFILDYINIPYLLGIDVSNLNFEIIEILVVILLYYFTYANIDKLNKRKEKNKQEIAVLMLIQCYKDILKTVDFLTDDIVTKYIVPKIDFDSTKNPIVLNTQNIPYENEGTIITLISEGVLDINQIQNYYKIKSDYRAYVNMRKTCFDDHTKFDGLKYALLDEIKAEIEVLETLKGD